MADVELTVGKMIVLDPTGMILAILKRLKDDFKAISDDLARMERNRHLIPEWTPIVRENMLALDAKLEMCEVLGSDDVKTMNLKMQRAWVLFETLTDAVPLDEMN
jgi:hypothetical protein